MNKIEEDNLKHRFNQIEELSKNDPEQALLEAEEIDPVSLPNELKYDYYHLAGNLYYDMDKYEDAIKCYKIVLKSKKLEKKDLGKIYKNLASIYNDKEMYNYSIKYAKKAIEYFNDDKVLSEALHILASNFRNKKKFNKSIACWLRILDIYKEKRTDSWSKYMVESSYSCLCFDYWKLGNEVNSDLFYNKLTQLDGADDLALSGAYLCRAHRFYENRHWEEALEYYIKATSLMNNEEEKNSYHKFIKDCENKLKTAKEGRPQI